MDLYAFSKVMHEQHLREAAKKQMYEELTRHNRPFRSRLHLGELLNHIFKSAILPLRAAYAHVRVRVAYALKQYYNSSATDRKIC
jgi:hypothetical protein